VALVILPSCSPSCSSYSYSYPNFTNTSNWRRRRRLQFGRVAAPSPVNQGLVYGVIHAKLLDSAPAFHSLRSST